MKYKVFQSINNYHTVQVSLQGKNACICININIEEVKSFILLMSEIHEFIKSEDIQNIIYKNDATESIDEFDNFDTFFNYVMSLYDIKKL
jgi:hypothetical protein